MPSFFFCELQLITVLLVICDSYMNSRFVSLKRYAGLGKFSLLCSKSSVPTYCETILFPVGIYLFKVNNKITRKWCEICPKLTKKTPEQR